MTADALDNFDHPIELRSIQSADRMLARFIPVLMLIALGVLVLALLVLGLAFPRMPQLYSPLSVLIALAVPAMMYLQKRRQLMTDTGRSRS